MYKLAIFFLILSTSVHAIPEKIILVDGLTAPMTGRCTFQNCTDRDSYLWQELGDILQNQMDARGTNADIHAFEWSGDMVKHGEQLKSKFRNWFFSQVCAPNTPCNLSFIAHSWGSVIATDFLASQEDNHNLKVRTMVTLGSPATGAKARLENLPFITVTPFWIKAIEKVTSPYNFIDGQAARWVNVVNSADPIGWDYLTEHNQPFAGVENLKADGTPSSKGRLHNAYPLNESELDPAFLPVALTPGAQGIDFLKAIIGGWLGSRVSSLSDMTGGMNMDAHGVPAYQPQRLAAYVTERLPVVIPAPMQPTPSAPTTLATGSVFHGAGSLIDPETNCYGCNQDIAMMHPASVASTVVFQSKNVGRCPYLEIQAEGLNSLLIASKAWSEADTQDSYLAQSLPVSIPTYNLWNTTAVTSLQPVTQSTAIYAYCRSRDTYPAARKTASNTKIQFSNGYAWAGNGSIISRDSRGSSFGNIRDVAITHENQASLTAFQWQTSPRCSRLKLYASSRFSGKLHVKAWNSATDEIAQNVTFPYTLQRNYSDLGNNYWVISLETAANAVPFGKIYAACE